MHTLNGVPIVYDHKDLTINVLDHGHVRLVEHMGSDLSIVRAARVSYNAEWRTGEDAGKDEKLIDYLMKNRHTSPFESVILTFDVKAPIFVFRQWHRHRMWSYNEVSARYTELPSEYYVPDPLVIGAQSKDNKQARDLSLTPAQAPWDLSEMIDLFCNAAFGMYQRLLAMGCPRELARGVLPMNTYSHMFATVDLHNLFHFLELRLHPHAQWEIRQYAEALLKLAEFVVPVACAAFRKYRLTAS